MRRKITYLLLSFFLIAGSVEAFADRHDNRGGKDRQEQRGHRSNNGNHRGQYSGKGNHSSNKGNSGHKNDKKHNDKNVGRPGGNHSNMNQGRPGGNHGNMNQGRPGSSKPAPGKPGVGRPVPPPPPPAHRPAVRPGYGHHYSPGPGMPPPPPPRLPHMVNFVTRGCHDVNVWQVSPTTFIVRYRRGHNWYTQYIYPYSNSCGVPTLISVNWQPLSPWTLIPPIQLNINL